MNRYRHLALAIVPLLCSFGCEDGPKDQYQTASPSAALAWNDPRASTSAQAAQQGFMTSTAGVNKNDICTPDELKAARSKYFAAPIMPPGIAAGLDIAGGPAGDGSAGYEPEKPFTYDPAKETWVGATVEQAEQILCQGTPDQVFFGDSNALGWGDNNEVSVSYNANNRIIEDIILQTGYEGSIEADSTDGHSHYSIHFNNAPLVKTVKDAMGNPGPSQSVIIRWSDQPALNKLANELFDALRNTFVPDFPPDDDCVAAGHCIIGNNFSAGGYLWFTPLNMSFFVNTTVGTDAANSAFVLFDLGKLKLLGFSTASSLLKLDAAGEGPVAVRTRVWNQDATCKYRLGMNFAEFKRTCVEPFGDDRKNQIEDNKLFGAVGHGVETYHFDVQGIDPQFVESSLAEDAVVGDGEKPGDDDEAYELSIDQEVLGPIANDYANNDTTQSKDLHGLGLVTLEWANLVQRSLKTRYGVTTDLGDPDCVKQPSRSATAGKVCSGLEGIVTTAPPAAVGASMAVNALGPAIVTDPAAKRAFASLGLGLKPGTWFSFFCTDGGGLDSAGHPVGYDAGAHHCFGQDAATHNGYYFDTMLAMVQNAYGGASATPKQLTDLRFYFQQWIVALIKYLRVADKPAATLADVDAQAVNLDDLFFDASGGGFELGEYIERQSVNSASQAPTDFTVVTNLLTSVISEYSFLRHNFRGERALYQVLTTDPHDQPGAERVLISNLVGSPVLAQTYGSYDCAINADPMKCQGVLGPVDAQGKPLLDDDGNPLLAGYAGAFGTTHFAIPALGAAATPSGLKVEHVYPLISSALVSLPKWSNPFDPSSARSKDPKIQVLLPYAPKGASVGFPVSIDGSRDKFVDTNAIDFSGAGVSANVDYDFIYDDKKQPSLVIKAIETQDFLGSVFLCAQPNDQTGNPDLLAVRMYTPSQDILDWFTEHPHGMSDCDMVFKYSSFGNYPDFITSRANGIRLGINPGFGGGRVTDVVVFDPNVVASLGE